MNSDETPAAVNTLVAQKEATTEAIMSSEMGGQSMVDSDPVAKLDVQPTKVDSIKKQVTVVQTQAPINVTSGEWFDLPILYRAQSTAPTFDSIDYIGQVELNYLLGLITATDIENSGTNRIMQISDPGLQRFYNFKLDSVTQHFKNFNILVERDQSGGLQIQDPFIFQIRRVYYQNWQSGSAQFVNTTAFSLSDLSHGISSHYVFNNLGWIPGTALVGGTTGIYNSLQSIIGDRPTNTQFALYPETVPYRWQMRLANFGVFTNVIVNLAYISEINASWTAQSSLITGTVLPTPQLPDTLKKQEEEVQDRIVKKRKLINIE